jgi:hypothetical protein
MNATEALEREALRLYRRYACEVVERYALCPWAASARKDGRVAEQVLLAAEPREALEPTLAALEELAQRPEIEIGLFIYPRLALERLAFEHFVAAVRHADAGRHELGGAPFALAAFHPAAPARLDDAERLIPFVRRTPDPTIQLVRRTALERVRGPQGTGFFDIDMLTPHALLAEPVESLRVKIARQNLETVERVGVAELEALFEDIQRDRAASYASLAATCAGA